MYKVLIVDDMKSWQTINTKLMQKFLNGDVEITQTSSAKEAYQKALENKNEPFDIILTDLQMETDFSPKVAGEWLVEQIKMQPEYKNTFILLISASFGIQNIAKRLDVAYIRKSNLVSSPQALFYMLEENNFIPKEDQ